MNEPDDVPGMYRPSDRTDSPASQLPPDTPPPPTIGAPPASRGRRWPWIAAAAGFVAVTAAVVVAAIGITAAARIGPDNAGAVFDSATVFESAKKTCTGDLGDDSASVRLGDDGQTLLFDGRSSADTGSGASLETLACYLGALKTPDFVIAQMNGTRALDGRQTAEWSGITASWTYHPDQGIDIAFTLK